MGKYKESFEFNTSDIDLIEQAIRHEISSLSSSLQSDVTLAETEQADLKARIKKLQLVLGKIHNQKIWYGQTHPTGTPIAG